MGEITIKRISIRNFRSISKIDINTNKIAIFVGQNDAGKSNILRALNLFFNNETNPETPLDFQTDFYIKGARNRKADEISVELELELPENYRETNGDTLIWRKAWRKETNIPESDNYFGRRIITGARGGRKYEDIEIPSKSNLHATLRQIDYRYVPATKNTDFFDALRGEIYHTISSVAQSSFHQSSQDFEKDISKHLHSLTNDLATSLGFESKLSLPNDLSPLFKTLDFIDLEKIPLKNRGDGIKARHIPHILFFMAQKRKELSVRGGPRYTTIWGYEEPENNLEMTSCSLLAKEIFEYCENGIAQTLLTTHSPIFYNVGKEYREQSSVHYVYKDGNEEKTLCKNEDDVGLLDGKMGVTRIYADKIIGLQNELRNLHTQAQENQKSFENLQNKETLSRIFVEGESDKIIITRCLRAFFPEKVDSFLVETKPSGAGYKYVIDMLQHWRARHKHHPDESKAVGIVDEDAKNEKNEWNKVTGNVSSAKCYILPKTQPFRDLDKSLFNVNCTLETLYPENIWQYARDRDWLEEIPKTKYLKEQVIDKIMNQESSLEEIINENTPLFVSHKFISDKKIPVARHINGKSDDYIRENFSVVENLLSEIIDYIEN